MLVSSTIETVTLAVGCVAAAGAVGAVVVPLWQQRTRLELRFRDGFQTGPDRVSVPARVENPGASPVYDVELFAGPPGLTLEHHRLDRVNLQPRTFHNFYVELSRPAQADIEPGRTVATLHAPLLVVARYGRRAIFVEMPAGPCVSRRAVTKRHRLRWP